LKISYALEATYRRGLIHRDIKPQNVLMTDYGEAKVADFGVAKVTEVTLFTEPGSLIGTVHFLSPE
jgi:serine/threonine-protein kinase